jgi:hypothetical protein
MPAKRTEPHARDLEILKAAGRLGASKAAQKVCCSRALIYQLRTRFPEAYAQFKAEFEAEQTGQKPEEPQAVPVTVEGPLQSQDTFKFQASVSQSRWSDMMVRLAQAAELLKQCRDPMLANKIAREAEAMEHTARNARAVEEQAARIAKCDAIIVQARAIRVRAEQKIGTLLNDLEKHPGGRPDKTGSRREPVLATLKDLQISKKRSSECQAIARMAERAPRLFARLCEDVKFSRSAALSQFRRFEAADEPKAEPEPELAVLNVLVLGTTEDEFSKIMSYLGRLPAGAVFHAGSITQEQFRRWSRGGGPAPWETGSSETPKTEPQTV